MRRVVVACNKMDELQYNEERFKDCSALKIHHVGNGQMIDAPPFGNLSAFIPSATAAATSPEAARPPND